MQTLCSSARSPSVSWRYSVPYQSWEPQVFTLSQSRGRAFSLLGSPCPACCYQTPGFSAALERRRHKTCVEQWGEHRIGRLHSLPSFCFSHARLWTASPSLSGAYSHPTWVSQLGNRKEPGLKSLWLKFQLHHFLAVGHLANYSISPYFGALACKWE